MFHSIAGSLSTSSMFTNLPGTPEPHRLSKSTVARPYLSRSRRQFVLYPSATFVFVQVTLMYRLPRYQVWLAILRPYPQRARSQLGTRISSET